MGDQLHARTFSTGREDYIRESFGWKDGLLKSGLGVTNVLVEDEVERERAFLLIANHWEEELLMSGANLGEIWELEIPFLASLTSESQSTNIFTVARPTNFLCASR